MTDHPNLQDVLWSASGPVFWGGMSFAAAINALLLFHHLLTTADRNALTIGRLGWLGGCILAIFIPFNSGMQIWSLALIITSGAFISLLILTNWCGRKGSFTTKILAVIHDLLWARAKSHKVDAD